MTNHEMLQNLDIDSNDLKIMKNIYWNQEAAMRVENMTGKYQQIYQRVR